MLSVDGPISYPQIIPGPAGSPPLRALPEPEREAGITPETDRLPEAYVARQALIHQVEHVVRDENSATVDYLIQGGMEHLGSLGPAYHALLSHLLQPSACSDNCKARTGWH